MNTSCMLTWFSNISETTTISHITQKTQFWCCRLLYAKVYFRAVQFSQFSPLIQEPRKVNPYMYWHDCVHPRNLNREMLEDRLSAKIEPFKNFPRTMVYCIVHQKSCSVQVWMHT